MQPLSIRNVSIGEGTPEVIVSLMGKSASEAIVQGLAALEAGADCLEWRADFCENVHDARSMALDAAALRSAFGDALLLFTFRSTPQGGQMELPVPEYVELTDAMIRTGAFDIVDVESWIGDEQVRVLSDAAHECGVAVIVSHHDFEKTPSVEWMVSEMRRFQELGADIPKIAVMAHDASDTLRLLQATEEMHRLYASGPLITMAMGRYGALSRLCGEVFGSAMTFCAVKEASAPGQVDIALARMLMEGIHTIHAR